MYRPIIILAILLVAVLPATAIAQESAGGVINGQLTNETEGGGSIAGIDITLITYVNDMVVETETTKTDSEGKFQFYDVNIEHEYLVSARYMEVDYYYPVIFEPDETVAYVEIAVCDATTSDEEIRVGLAHTIINVEEEGLQVTEVFWLVNDGDKTYVGTDGVLVFTLPEGAANFEAPQELMRDYQYLGDNRVTYLVPFPPGERQLVHSYQLAKPGSDDFSIPLKFNYPTDSFELIVGGEAVEVAVTQLAPAEPVVTDAGERFIHFHGENFPRDTVVSLRLTRLSEDSGLSSVILWGIIAVLIISVAIYLVKRKKGGDTSE